MVRRRLIVLAVVASVAVVILTNVFSAKGPFSGPLQPTEFVESFGNYAENGSTISLVVELRGEVQVEATLQSVDLANPDSGLTLVGSGILTGAFQGYVVTTYPPGPMKPITGTDIITKPGDPSGDVFIVLGIKVDLAQGPQSARGVWLNYAVGGSPYRALLPWLLTVCPAPGTGPCEGQDSAAFDVPTPND